MKPGESRTIEVTFPAEYGAPTWPARRRPSRSPRKTLSRAVVPALDDELAKKLGFDDLAAHAGGDHRAASRREYDQLARLRLKRQLLDALAGRGELRRRPRAWWSRSSTRSGSAWRPIARRARLDEDDKDKDEETLKADYRAIAERRVRLGLLLAEIGRVNSITVAPDEMTRAMRTEAMRYPGQEQQVFEFFRQNPRATETLRGPLFEEKVIDFILELAKVEEKTVTPEELAQEPETRSAGGAAPRQPTCLRRRGGGRRRRPILADAWQSGRSHPTYLLRAVAQLPA